MSEMLGRITVRQINIYKHIGPCTSPWALREWEMRPRASPRAYIYYIHIICIIFDRWQSISKAWLAIDVRFSPLFVRIEE